MPFAFTFAMPRAGSATADARADESFAGPALEDARDSLTYWHERHARLPRHRLTQRREARAMIVRWDERVRQAEVERFGAGPGGRLMAAFQGGGIGGAAIIITRVAAGFLARLVPAKVVLAAVAVAIGLTLVACGLFALVALQLFGG